MELLTFIVAIASLSNAIGLYALGLRLGAIAAAIREAGRL